MAEPQTDTAERVRVAEGVEPAAAGQSAPKARLNVIQRMAAIRAECDAVGKQDIKMKSQDQSKEWTIKGHTIEAVLAETRPLLTRHGVGLTPNLVERAFRGNACDVIVDWRFEALDDTTDRETVRWGGTGTDNGDKAFAKAGTNCLKEMLKKVFLITDREDAKEETESVEHKTDEGMRREDMEVMKRERQAAIEQWAKTFKSALETAQSTKDVGRLQAENSEQLASPDLADVTRKFFFDLIQSRKKALAEVEADRKAEVI